MSLVKTEEEIIKLHQSGKILARIMKRLKVAAKIGVSLMELEELAKKLIVEADSTPAFLGYQAEGARFPYPYAICSSLNAVAVHGKPSDYRLQSGDLLKLDVGVNYHGAITDSATTVGLGRVDSKVIRLLKVTERALEAGIKAAKAGGTVGDIGFAVERVVTAGGMHVLEELTGHGTGNILHEDPTIYNFGQPGSGMELKEGMVLAIEPITSIGTSAIIDLPDGSYETADKSVSAHFEHTVLVTKKAAEILTA